MTGVQTCALPIWDATHAQICDLAEVNIASINYHFRSKSELYRTVWHEMMEDLDRKYPLGPIAESNQPPERKVESLIEAILRRSLDPELGTFQCLFMMEFHNPTGLVDDLLQERFAGYRKMLHCVLQEFAGGGAPEEQVELCELSLMSQCRAVHIARQRQGKVCPPWQFTQDDLDRLKKHIAEFSLAGLTAILRK